MRQADKQGISIDASVSRLRLLGIVMAALVTVNPSSDRVCGLTTSRIA